ncbi:unnamed protein product [Soboliphyme baturini]|uniref:PBPe domain-containing protein n=1 Tax=Soboliphyme baturini TaxID=241478 RepID=A0A183IU47_9BILA|nr:unnamed protein product [Soboliphyme baturini]
MLFIKAARHHAFDSFPGGQWATTGTSVQWSLATFTRQGIMNSATFMLLLYLVKTRIVLSTSRLFEELADRRAARLVRGGGLDCDSHYLQLDFICDPNHLLSHTEAALLNETISRNFTHCFIKDTRRSKREVLNKYSIGLALAKTIHGADLHDCSEKTKSRIDLFDQHPETGKFVHLAMKHLAIQLRLIAADSGHELLLAVSFSDRVRKLISEQNAMSMFKRTLSRSDPRMPLTMISTENIVTAFKMLDSILWNVSSVKKSPSRLPSQKIPLWALILFVISFVLTVVCATVGHLVAYGKRARFNSQHTSVFAKTTPNGRWRAGFGGGLMKIRNNSPFTNQSHHVNNGNFGPRTRLGGGLILARRKDPYNYSNPYRVV